MSGFIPCNLFETRFGAQLPGVPFVVDGHTWIFAEGDSDAVTGSLTWSLEVSLNSTPKTSFDEHPCSELLPRVGQNSQERK